jgi:hypothetical protein
MHRLLIIALVLGPLGCEVSRALDVDKVKESIEEGVEEQMGVKVDEVDCPEQVWEKPGESFKCKVETKDGDTIKVSVEMRGEGKVKWATIGPKPPRDEEEEE